MQKLHELTAPDCDALLEQFIAGQLPDQRGYFGPFGGCFAPEILMPALARLCVLVQEHLGSSHYRKALRAELHAWAGRPTRLTRASGLSERWGVNVWLKREDQARTGSCSINNALGQALLAKEAGAVRVVAASGSGRHGVAVAAACRHVDLPGTIYLGAPESNRRSGIVQRIRERGVDVVGVKDGDRSLCTAIDEAFRDWVADPDGTYYLAGSVTGPHPYPRLVRELQSVIGLEARAQMLESAGCLPDAVFAPVGEGAGASGLFQSFVGDRSTRLIGIEAGGRNSEAGQHAAALCRGSPGIMHGCLSLWLQDADGQLQPTWSVANGMSYPGAGPDLALLQAIGRAQFAMVPDDEAIDARDECARVENIRCGIEAAHALAGARRWAAARGGRNILICIDASAEEDDDSNEHAAAGDGPGIGVSA